MSHVDTPNNRMQSDQNARLGHFAVYKPTQI